MTVPAKNDEGPEKPNGEPVQQESPEQRQLALDELYKELRSLEEADPARGSRRKLARVRSQPR